MTRYLLTLTSILYQGMLRHALHPRDTILFGEESWIYDTDHADIEEQVNVLFLYIAYIPNIGINVPNRKLEKRNTFYEFTSYFFSKSFYLFRKQTVKNLNNTVIQKTYFLNQQSFHKKITRLKTK